MDILEILVKEFKIKQKFVENVIALLDEGNTVPFIARYRKEQTGEMKDETIRDLADRLNYLRNLESRKEEVKRLIGEQEKLTKELELEIEKAQTLQRLDDLYRPFRQKRRTRGSMAKEKGLESLAHIILEQKIEEENLQNVLNTYINEEKGISSAQEAIAGAEDIIAEMVSDDPDYRKDTKKIIEQSGIINSKGVDEETSVYSMYYDYKEPIKSIANHRILALNRGEKDKKLKVNINVDENRILELINIKILKRDSTTKEIIKRAVEDGWKRLLFPSLEREIRNDLKERAEEDAIKVFSENLKPLLMQPPIKDKNILALDPGFRTGCKVAVIDGTGKFLDNAVVYPTHSEKIIEKAKETLKSFIEKYDIDIVAIGNGTASRETESLVAEILQELNKEVSYIIVSEAGASIYSASKIGIKEFPDLDVTIRGAISIGRRLQDPLAELVKIEPKHIGVGQYQHDLNQKKLDESLKGVVEECVNKVGVDLNTASPSLLSYVAGLSNKVAETLVSTREEKGKFKSRKELLKVKGLGPKTFQQCAGFLRIENPKNPLDNTGVHPESYDIALKLLEIEYKDKDIEALSKDLNVGKPTLIDIIEELEKPGRDPRDEMIKPLLRQDVLNLDDLKIDMILKGTVRNVVDFGAFVDIGVKEDGLVHISQLSNKFIKHPKDIVTVGDIVEVKIIDIDKGKGRISLTMKEV
ncbi:Tex family protein [Tissierella creatinophila]|uniref:30S ribosomal protein S1 n=1 Tax=Tissierella creatinophila DSM 6911 TaxID=1123403 RepID=A0A1U7M3H9_TISCR|nr:Tex family protein [Tissierella creatinophila]OLS01851.1 30S ribosomal protein S1 [Tissierella creatinophila DSM 6911]